MNQDPYSLWANEHGCNACGATGNVFYVVQFYILPQKLLKACHRKRRQTAMYCRPCYEADADLPFLIDGQAASVPKTPRSDDLENIHCFLCDLPLVTNHGRLYGSITSSLHMDGSIIESFLLGYFCSRCVESHRISLVGNLCLPRG